MPPAPGREESGTFDQAVVEMRAVVGPEHVTLDSGAIAQHSRDTIPWQRTCAAVVYPGSRDEVCALAKIAAQHRLPLWTFSKGKNWGYGATMAAEGGAVVLILERMNRILEVNEDLAYAVIEPGVAYRQLAEHLKSQGIKLWADCTDSTPEGSVLGNALDRGLGHTPYGDHFGNLCGLEVVLANGDVIQTGGAPPESPAWHTFKWGSGPYLEGLFSQSNFGVFTRAGIWLMPEPKPSRRSSVRLTAGACSPVSALARCDEEGSGPLWHPRTGTIQHWILTREISASRRLMHHDGHL